MLYSITFYDSYSIEFIFLDVLTVTIIIIFIDFIIVNNIVVLKKFSGLKVDFMYVKIRNKSLQKKSFKILNNCIEIFQKLII